MKSSLSSPRARLVFGLLALGLILTGVFTLPVRQWLEAAIVWRELHPVIAPIAYVAAVATMTPMMVPGSLLMMSGGFIFGLAWGAALATVGVGIGATLACLAGRSFARPLVEHYTDSNAQFRALNAALDQRGFLVVVLTRLSLIIPYNVLNYAYGMTNIKMRTYAPATAVGMLPAAVLFAYLGSLAGNVDSLFATDARGGATGRVVLVVGLIAISLAVYVVQRTAARELKKQMAQNARD